MKNAQQKRRNMMNQPAGWGFVVDHTPGQIPRIVNVDALMHVDHRMFAMLGKLEQKRVMKSFKSEGGRVNELGLDADTFRKVKQKAVKK